MAVFSSVTFWAKRNTTGSVGIFKPRICARQSKPFISKMGRFVRYFLFLSVGGLSHWNFPWRNGSYRDRERFTMCRFFPLYNIKYLYSNIICINFTTKISEYYLIKKYQLFKNIYVKFSNFHQRIFGGQNASKKHPNGIGTGYQPHE